MLKSEYSIDESVLEYDDEVVGFEGDTAIVYEDSLNKNAEIPLNNRDKIRFCYFETQQENGFFLEFDASAECYIVADEEKYPIRKEFPSIDEITLEAMCDAEELYFESSKGKIVKDEYGIVKLLAQVYYHTFVDSMFFSYSADELMELQDEIYEKKEQEEEEKETQLQDKIGCGVIYGIIVLGTVIIIVCLLNGAL